MNGAIGRAESLDFAHRELRKNLRATRRAQRRLLRNVASMDSGMAASREWLLSDVDALDRKAVEIESRLGLHEGGEHRA